MKMNKRFLIIGFSPGVGIFLNALKQSLIQQDTQTTLVGELAMRKSIPRGFRINPQLINSLIKYENNFYNPKQLSGLKKQMENYASRCLYHLEKIYAKNNFTDLIVWNGGPIFAQSAIILAKARNIKIWYLENGSLPQTLQLDNKGVNFNNSLSGKDKEFYIKQNLSFDNQSPIITPLPHPNKLLHPLEMFARYINRFGWFWSITYIFWNNFLLDQYGKYLRKTISADKITLPDRFIFIPLQVKDDTQIITHSPYIKNMEQFVEICYIAIKKVDPTLGIVVKEHPQDFGRRNYKKFSKKYPDIIWLKKYPINEVLEKSSLVITINSTVGVEALVHNKPVITLGNAFFNIDGLVYHATNLDQLPKLIKLALEKKPNLILIDRFLGFLQKKYFINGSWRKFSGNTLNELTKRLLS